MATVSETMGEIRGLLERMSRVRPELSRLAKGAASIQTVLEDNLGLADAEIDALEDELAAPASLRGILENDTLSKALVEALELAVAVDGTDHYLGRVLEIVKDSVYGRVGNTGEA